MDLSALQVFVKLILFLLILISSVYLGQTCTMSPSVTESAGNASILQGSNHTFWCKGNSSNILWDINGTSIHKYPVDSKLKVVSLELSIKNGCTSKSLMTVHAGNSSGSNTLSVFAIQCTVLSDSFPFFGPSEVAYLNVHVIGKVRDFELIPPVTSSKPAVMQWKAPYVFSGSSSPLHYNITVRDSSMQVIAQSTTMDTNFTISSDLLVPCDSYLLTVLPFQQMPTHVELGMMMQAVKNYSGTLLPATDIQSSVSVDSFAATATIHFQASFASCYLQWPEKFIVVLMQDGLNESDTFQSTEQIVQEGMNEYKLESLALRQKYRVSVKMENKYSSADSEFLNISTFEVQTLLLETVTDKNQLNVRCVMADGVQNKHCTVEIRSETGDIQCNCTKTDGASASCVLRGLPLGEYLVWAYDEGYNDNPAVTVVFNITEEPIDVSTETSGGTDEAATTESSPSREEDSSTTVIATILAAVAVGIVIVTLVITLLLVKCRHRTKIQSEVALENHTCTSATVTYTYELVEGNEREVTPPPPLPVSPPPPVHRNPAYLPVTLKHTLPIRPSSTQPEYEIVQLQNPAYLQVTPKSSLPTRPSITWL